MREFGEETKPLLESSGLSSKEKKDEKLLTVNKVIQNMEKTAVAVKKASNDYLELRKKLSVPQDSTGQIEKAENMIYVSVSAFDESIKDAAQLVERLNYDDKDRLILAVDNFISQAIKDIDTMKKIEGKFKYLRQTKQIEDFTLFSPARENVVSQMISTIAELQVEFNEKAARKRTTVYGTFNL